MRSAFALIVLIAASASAVLAPPAGAQSATVQASVTVVDPLRVQVDASQARSGRTQGGMQLSAPLRLTGAGSPPVSVRVDDAAVSCETVAAGAGDGDGGGLPRLSCVSRHPPTGEGEPVRATVTLVIAPMT